MITAYIDADWLLYAAGFAGQKTELVATCEDLNSPAKGALVAYGPFPNITAVREAMDVDIHGEYQTYTRTVLDEPSHFFHSAKHMIEAQLKKIHDKFGEDVKPVLLMDGDGNFRNRIATIRPYKGNRAINSKPLMYNEIKKYLIDNWDAEMIYGQETDDEMAIRQTQAKGKTIIVAVDKDMLQVPGWHLNPQKGFRKVSEVQGRTFLYRQCLTGDSVDNIAGCYKVGPKKAEQIILPEMSEDEMWGAVVTAYSESIDKHGNKYEGLSALTAAIENMRLVYLRREYGENWSAPA